MESRTVLIANLEQKKQLVVTIWSAKGVINLGAGFAGRWVMNFTTIPCL